MKRNENNGINISVSWRSNKEKKYQSWNNDNDQYENERHGNNEEMKKMAWRNREKEVIKYEGKKYWKHQLMW